MASSSVKTRTKDDLRGEAIKRFKVSKKAFDAESCKTRESSQRRLTIGGLSRPNVRWNSQRQAKSHNSKVFDSKESHPKQREFAVWPQIPTGMLQPTFISPGGARVAVNDGFRLMLGSES